jgi:hypothetical protein
LSNFSNRSIRSWASYRINWLINIFSQAIFSLLLLLFLVRTTLAFGSFYKSTFTVVFRPTWLLSLSFTLASSALWFWNLFIRWAIVVKLVIIKVFESLN